jgi:hypothetical protein
MAANELSISTHSEESNRIRAHTTRGERSHGRRRHSHAPLHI